MVSNGNSHSKTEGAKLLVSLDSPSAEYDEFVINANGRLRDVLDAGLFDMKQRLAQEFTRSMSEVQEKFLKFTQCCDTIDESLLPSQNVTSMVVASSQDIQKREVPDTRGSRRGSADESMVIAEFSSVSVAEFDPNVVDANASDFASPVPTYVTTMSSMLSNQGPLMRWRTLFVKLMSPKTRLALQTNSYYVHECWASYLSLLRNNKGHQAEFTGALRKIMNARIKISDATITSTMTSRFAAVLWVQKLVLHPIAFKRLAWLMLCFIALLCDAVVVPLGAFFEFSDSQAFGIMLWVTPLFWLLDIFVTFGTGRYVHGVLEMRLAHIARLYAQSWLVFDVSFLLFDFTLLFVDTVSEDKVNPVLRSVRILRLIRLFRLLKLQGMLGDALAINNKRVLAYSPVVRISIVYLIYIHILACMWYGLGQQQDSRWVSECRSHATSQSHCYFAAAHWALAQIHGSSPIDYTTTAEWAFAILSSFVGLILFAFFLGRAVHAIIRRGNSIKLQLRQQCTRYTKNHHLSTNLSHRLLRYIDSSELQEDVAQRLRQEREMLQHLPASLQAEILEEARKPFVSVVGLIRDLQFVSAKMVTQICSEAVSEDIALSGETVFACGETADRWRVVDSGHLIYVFGKDLVFDFATSLAATLRTDEQAGKLMFQMHHKVNREIFKKHKKYDTWESFVAYSQNKGATSLTKGTSIGEMTLWTPWVHTGDLIVTGDCVMLNLTLESFLSVLRIRVDTCMLAARYSQQYVRQLSMVRGAVSDVFNAIEDDLLDEYEIDFGAVNPHKIFLSHYKAEAGTEAALMQGELQELIVREEPEWEGDSAVFLDSEDLADLSVLKDHITKSESLVLLLTPGVLTRPWCLIEIVTAMNNGVPVVPVEIQRPGLNFEYPNDTFYAKLLKNEILADSAIKVLDSHEITLEDIEKTLRTVFLKIAVPFSPHKSHNVRESELLDIIRRCSPAAFVKTSSMTMKMGNASNSGTAFTHRPSHKVSVSHKSR